MTPLLLMALCFIFGACIGSFLNVCIYRIPHQGSLMHPGSHCPKCNHPIRYYDNIPIFSYFWLRGKCRNCGVPISFRYPLIEFLTGILACACVIRFGIHFEAGIYFCFIAALIVISFIDLDHQIVPDVISLPGIPVGLAASFLLPNISFVDAFLGMVCGGGILYAIAWTYYLITGKEGMGGGDIKLLAMIGAFVGWKGVLVVIFIASATGALAGTLLMIMAHKNLKYAVPFGPFLSIGAMLYVFKGPDLIAWYYRAMAPA